MSERDINLGLILHGCREGNSNSQRKLYEHYYGYAMNIALRYTRAREEAVEIMNDGFYKVLTNLDKYDPEYPFKKWLRRIIINSAIDYHRKYHKNPTTHELKEGMESVTDTFDVPILDGNLDVLPILQKLTPAYRMVFNLFVIEGYKHHEIASMLGISANTSRSNLVRAKEKLRNMLIDNNGEKAVKIN